MSDLTEHTEACWRGGHEHCPATRPTAFGDRCGCRCHKPATRPACHRCGAPLGGHSLRAFTVTPQGAECAVRDGCDERVAVASGAYRQPAFRVVAKRVLT